MLRVFTGLNINSDLMLIENSRFELKMFKAIFICLLIVLAGINVNGQQTLINSDPERFYKLGYELYLKEKYSAAIQEFERTLQNPAGISHAAIVKIGRAHV